VFIEEEEQSDQTKIYTYVGDSLKELKAALTKAAELLSGAHFGFRMEVAGGR
jgi:hypothetical protein